MRDRITFGQVIGMCLVLLFLIGVIGLGTPATPTSDTPTREPEDLAPAKLAGTDTDVDDLPTPSWNLEPVAAGHAGTEWDCANLVTPDRIGHDEFARYGIAEKLQNNEFVRLESLGYIVCSHGKPRDDGDLLLPLFADIYYMFDKENGELAVTHIEWTADLLEPTPTPEPTRQPAEAVSADDAATTTVCIDPDAPIIEIGGENPEQWNIWDILSGPCAVEMTGSLCWDCGEDLTWRWLVPVPGSQEPGGTPSGEGGSQRACLDARTAVLISGQELDEGDDSRLASNQCSLQLGRGQLCWYCREPRPEPSPSPLAAHGEAEAMPAERARKEPVCSDYITPDKIGDEEWEHYGIAERLRSNDFEPYFSQTSDRIVCYADRMIDETLVIGDELYYRFDIESGELQMKRIHWREDLPEHLPVPLLGQQQAEAMVEGEVQHSYLAVLPLDGLTFETMKPASVENPCWLVSSKVGSKVGSRLLEIVRVTFIDAVTGEVLGH